MFEVKNYEDLLGTEGMSDELLKNHFTLYQGYVKNINLLNDTLIQLEKDGKYDTPEYAELNRRFGWEFNGMRLHELYFSAITKGVKPLKDDSALMDAIKKEFGSFEFFIKDYKAMAAMRGIGWVILYYDKEAQRLFNVWINEHDKGHLAGATPLLPIDVFEHAYMLDYGTKKPAYIESFIKAIDWNEINKRFES